MKKLILLAGMVALAACTEVEPEADDAVAIDETSAMEADAAWTGFEPGAAQLTDADGVTMDYVINEDGTFTTTNTEGGTETGTVTMIGERGCFDMDGDDEGAMCWTNSQPGPDGSWQATSDNGDVATVRPMES